MQFTVTRAPCSSLLCWGSQQETFLLGFFGSDSSSSNDGWSTGRRAGNAKRKM